MSKLVKASEIKNVGARRFYRALIRWFKEEKHLWGVGAYKKFDPVRGDFCYCAVGGVGQSVKGNALPSSLFHIAKYDVALGAVQMIDIMHISDSSRSKHEMLRRVGQHLAALSPVEPMQQSLF